MSEEVVGVKFLLKISQGKHLRCIPVDKVPGAYVTQADAWNCFSRLNSDSSPAVWVFLTVTHMLSLKYGIGKYFKALDAALKSLTCKKIHFDTVSHVFSQAYQTPPSWWFLPSESRCLHSTSTMCRTNSHKKQKWAGHRREESEPVLKSGLWFKSAHVWRQTPHACVCVSGPCDVSNFLPHFHVPCKGWHFFLVLVTPTR